MQSRSVITRDDFVDAIKQFMITVELDPMAIFREGFSVTADQITGLSTVRPDDLDETEFVTVGQDMLYQEKAWPFLVDVVDSDVD